MRRRKKIETYTHVEEPRDIDVYVPYTRQDEKLQFVVDCLRIQRVQPQLVKVGNGTEYYDLLREAWKRERTFFIVEQDVVVWYGAIPKMEQCEFQWCTLATICHGREITTTFGCVKFSDKLLQQRPGFWDDIEPVWYHLDANFADKIGWPFIKPHSHWPIATHLNEVQWHDSVSTRYTLERKNVWRASEEGNAVASVEYIDEHGSKRVAHAHVETQGYEGDN